MIEQTDAMNRQDSDGGQETAQPLSVTMATAAGQQVQVPGVGLTASPSAVVYRDKLYLLHQGSGRNGQLWYTTSSNSTAWAADQRIANYGISDSPSGVVFRDKLYIFYQGAGKNGRLMYTFYNGSVWSSEAQVPNVGMSASPSAVVYRDTLYVFHHGSRDSGQIWYTTFNGSAWSADRQIGNYGITDSPGAAVFRDRIYLFHQGSRETGQFWYTTFNGSAWSADQQLTNVGLSGSPGPVVSFGDQLYVFHQGKGNSGQLWYLIFNGSTWTGDQLASGAAMSWSPSAVAFLSTLSAYYQGSRENGQLWRYVQEDLEIVGVEYHFDRAVLRDQTIVTVATQTLTNNTASDQELQFSLSGSVSETSSFENSKTNGVSLEVGRSFTASIPVVEGVEVGGSLNLGLSQSQTCTYGQTTTFTEQYTATFTVVAPPHSAVKGTSYVSKGKLDVPYTMTLRAQNGALVKTEGLWAGITSWDLHHRVDPAVAL